jgi:Xaa-Pro aminopeptidase
VSGRAERLIETLPEAGVGALLVTAPPNVRYLTGYTGSNGVAVIGADVSTFITDFRYVEQAAEEVDPSFERRIAPYDLLEELAETLGETPLALGFEDTHVSVRDHARLSALVGDQVRLVGVAGLVERLRAVKEPAEVERIRAAAQLADAAFQTLLEQGLTGRTERDVANALGQAMLELGAQRPAFDTIVAAGPHGALPHASPRDVLIGPGEVVVVDWGAELDGYCSDCTRTVATGDPGTEVRDVYQLVRSAQLAGLAAVRGGAAGRDVDAVARAVIEAAGHGAHFGHGLGHGVGIEIHESPRLSRRSQDELAAGNVATVEPGVYLPGRFGVRIEDLVVVVDDGREVLTSITKELIETG